MVLKLKKVTGLQLVNVFGRATACPALEVGFHGDVGRRLLQVCLHRDASKQQLTQGRNPRINTRKTWMFVSFGGSQPHSRSPSLTLLLLASLAHTFPNTEHIPHSWVKLNIHVGRRRSSFILHQVTRPSLHPGSGSCRIQPSVKSARIYV